MLEMECDWGPLKPPPAPFSQILWCPNKSMIHLLDSAPGHQPPLSPPPAPSASEAELRQD